MVAGMVAVGTRPPPPPPSRPLLLEEVPGGGGQERARRGPTSPSFSGLDELRGVVGELRTWGNNKLKPIHHDGLRKPGETPRAKMAHGKAGAGTDGSVYLSPSLWYASHPVYSQLKKIGEEQAARA